jgi:hypothetical protein
LYLANITKRHVKCDIFDGNAKYNMMNTDNDNNLLLDKKLAADLKSIGFIRAEQDLSEWCGKERSYFSCMRSRGYGLHIGSITLMAARIAVRMSATDDVRERARLRSALTIVNSIIHEKCKLREQELMAR